MEAEVEVGLKSRSESRGGLIESVGGDCSLGALLGKAQAV